MHAKDYVESIALALSRLRGGGLLLSPADAQLALSWHTAGVPLADVLHVVRTGKQRLRGAAANSPPRGAQATALSLHAFAAAVEQRARQARRARPPADAAEAGLSPQLRRATARARLPARGAWEDLAARADDLLSRGTDAYWSSAVDALLASLRELPRKDVRRVGGALRERRAPRPAEMPRRRYRRSLQLQLLSAASDTLGVPPAAFLL